MTEKYPRTYRALVDFGFSPMKAVQVMFDAKRKSTRAHAMVFIRAARRRASKTGLI